MKLESAKRPAFLKMGLFGDTGTGKTFTAAKVLSQFIKEFCPEKSLAMFDTEPSAGYIAPMVKKITGRELLVVTSRSFADMMDFWAICKKEGHVILIDSITHAWRNLMADFLEAKKSRITGAGGRAETARLTIADWGPLKEIWGRFSEAFAYDPIHACICGRQGDVWETVTDDEGKESQAKTGVKMKTESETGYEPSLLVQMRIEGENPVKHMAFVVKDRFDVLTGAMSKDKPDIEFFRPHLALLDLKGNAPVISKGAPMFNAGTGPNWETIKARREAVLEEIKNDLLLVYPGATGEDKKGKVTALREAFGTSAWTELESDEKKWPEELLKEKRNVLVKVLAVKAKPEAKKEKGE